MLLRRLAPPMACHQAELRPAPVRAGERSRGHQHQVRQLVAKKSLQSNVLSGERRRLSLQEQRQSRSWFLPPGFPHALANPRSQSGLRGLFGNPGAIRRSWQQSAGGIDRRLRFFKCRPPITTVLLPVAIPFIVPSLFTGHLGHHLTISPIAVVVVAQIMRMIEIGLPPPLG